MVRKMPSKDQADDQEQCPHHEECKSGAGEFSLSSNRVGKGRGPDRCVRGWQGHEMSLSVGIRAALRWYRGPLRRDVSPLPRYVRRGVSCAEWAAISRVTANPALRQEPEPCVGQSKSCGSQTTRELDADPAPVCTNSCQVQHRSHGLLHQAADRFPGRTRSWSFAVRRLERRQVQVPEQGVQVIDLLVGEVDGNVRHRPILVHLRSDGPASRQGSHRRESVLPRRAGTAREVVFMGVDLHDPRLDVGGQPRDDHPDRSDRVEPDPGRRGGAARRPRRSGRRGGRVA